MIVRYFFHAILFIFKECTQGPDFLSIIGMKQEAVSLLTVLSLFLASTQSKKLFLSRPCYQCWSCCLLGLLPSLAACDSHSLTKQPPALAFAFRPRENPFIPYGSTPTPALARRSVIYMVACVVSAITKQRGI